MIFHFFHPVHYSKSSINFRMTGQAIHYPGYIILNADRSFNFRVNIALMCKSFLLKVRYVYAIMRTVFKITLE